MPPSLGSCLFHSFLCGSCLWCWWWYRNPPGAFKTTMEPGEPPQVITVPAHPSSRNPSLPWDKRVEKECSLEGGPAPIPTSQAPGIRPPDSASTAPCSSYHFHVLNTWVNRTAGQSLAWQSPLQLSLPLAPELLSLPPIPGSLTPQQHSCSFFQLPSQRQAPSKPFSLDRYF